MIHPPLRGLFGPLSSTPATAAILTLTILGAAGALTGAAGVSAQSPTDAPASPPTAGTWVVYQGKVDGTVDLVAGPGRSPATTAPRDRR